MPSAVIVFPRRARLAFNAAAPAIAVMAANALAMLVGWGANLPTFNGVAFAPPAWLIGVAWLGVFGSLGVGRWEACGARDHLRDRSRWVTGLLVWSVAYVFVAGAFGPVWSMVHSVSLFALGAIALARVAPVSGRAGAWVAAPLVWIGYSVILSVFALNGQ